MDASKVAELKTHLEALEKARALEKEARGRLLKEGLPSDEQVKWAGILKEASSTVEALEKALETKLQGVRGLVPPPIS